MKNWYVVHTQTGLEDRVKRTLEAKIASKSAGEQITKVIVPTEQVSEIRSGRKKVSQRRFFPGYILVEMDLTDDTYFLIKKIPGVTGFIGMGKKPTPLTQEEVDGILKRAEDTQSKPIPKTVFKAGEQVRVTEGPFMNFNGTIEEIHPEKGKLKASVLIFGRATLVELEYWQVEKI